MAFDIDKWVDDVYSDHLDHLYRRHAEKVEKICREQLNNASIQYLSSSRVKNKNSLRAKLKKMKIDDPNLHWSQDMITADVFDIAGVRIAFYLPEQEERIHEIIGHDCSFSYTRNDLQVYPTGSTAGGQESTQPNYEATHWIVKLNQDGLRYPVEIQVVSVLRSSWAQIQHDYTYKSLNADISEAERQTLDAFGMNVALSEQLLTKLRGLRQNQEKEEFENIHTLGSFLIKWWHDSFKQQCKDLGSLDALLRLIRETKTPPLNTRGGLLGFLAKHVTLTTIEQTKQLFPDMEVRPTVVIMYQIVKEYRHELRPETNVAVRKERKSSLKLQTIMSTVLWLSDFFPPKDWEKPLRLGGLGEKQRVERLYWLGTPEPLRLIQQPGDFNKSTGTGDRHAVDDLWNIFKNYRSPAVQLALDISDAGILRNIAAELDLFNRVYMALGVTFKIELCGL